MATFSIRTWLATQLGCDDERLHVIERTPDGVDLLFGLDGAPFGQVHEMAPSTDGRRAVIAAWRGTGSASVVLNPGESIDW